MARRGGDQAREPCVNFAEVDQTRSVEPELSEAHCCSGFTIQMFLVMHHQSHFSTGTLAFTCFRARRSSPARVCCWTINVLFILVRAGLLAGARAA